MTVAAIVAVLILAGVVVTAPPRHRQTIPAAELCRCCGERRRSLAYDVMCEDCADSALVED